MRWPQGTQRKPCPLAGGVRGPDEPDSGTVHAGGIPALARKLVRGLLSDLPRKNCWTIAEWAGGRTLDGMQHLLGRPKWDADQVRAMTASPARHVLHLRYQGLAQGRYSVLWP